MAKTIEGLKMLLIAKKPVTGEKIKECFRKLVVAGEYFEIGSKIGVRYPSFGRNVQFVVALGQSAENPDLIENRTYKYIWIKAEQQEGISEEDFVKDINNPDLCLAEQAINLRDGLSKFLGYAL